MSIEYWTMDTSYCMRPIPPQLDEERLRRLRLLRAEEVLLPGHPQVEGGGHDDPGRGGRGVGGGLAVGGGQGGEQAAKRKFWLFVLVQSVTL